MTDSRRRKIINYSLLGALVLFIVIKGIGLVTTTLKAMNQRLPSTYHLRLEDSLLFNEESRRQLTVAEVQNSTVRQPLSFITYAGEYSLIVHPIGRVPQDLNKDFCVVEEESVSDVSDGLPYAVVDNNAFKFKYAIKANPAFSQVYLSLYGDSIQQVMRNDTMVCYSFRCKNLSVRYGKDEPVDLYVKADKYFSSGVPLSVLFYKKNNNLYFLLLSPNKRKSIDPLLLPALVSGS